MAMSTLLVFPAVMDAYAEPRMKIIADGFPELVIVDNDANDSDPTLGSIVYTGIGVGEFDVVVNLGVTKPFFGDEFLPVFDISVNAITTTPGDHNIVVEFSETDFNNSIPLLMNADVSANADNTAQLELFRDNDNVHFGQDISEYDTGIITGVLGLGAVPFTLNTSGDYSLTAVITINNDGAGSGFIDADMFTVEKILAGELLPMENMSLIIAGLQAPTMWFVPIVATGIGLAVFQIKKRYF